MFTGVLATQQLPDYSIFFIKVKAGTQIKAGCLIMAGGVVDMEQIKARG